MKTYANLMTKVSGYIVIICLIVVAIMLIWGFVKTKKAKKERAKRLGYSSLTSSQSVNVIKTKASKQRRLYKIPLGLALCYEDLNRDSSVKYVKFLNKLTKKYLKKKKYYKLNPSLDIKCSMEINDKVAKWFGLHKKEQQCQKVMLNRVFRKEDLE